MSTPTLRDRAQLLQDWIVALRTYSDRVRWFGANSLARAWGYATASMVEAVYQLYPALLRRYTVIASSGDELTEVASERGAQRLNATHAKVLVLVSPTYANVDGITAGTGPVAGGDEIEVDGTDGIVVGDTLRLRNGDGSVSEVVTVVGISVGTGPVSGNDEIEVGTIVGAYTPATDDVDVILRVSIAAGTEITTTAGVTFETLDPLVTGDVNAVFDGESTALSLADKVWAECTTAGESGNIEPRAIVDFGTPIAGILSIVNPERGSGGEDNEADTSLKYRAIHRPTAANQETGTWLEAMAKLGNTDVLRVLPTESSEVRTITALVLHRNGGALSAAELNDLEDWLAERSRSYMLFSLSNLTLTAVEVEAEIALSADATLEGVWKAAASALADYLDWRTWPWGQDVDEADLLTIVNGTDGIAALTTAAFLPAADVAVGDESLPYLVSLSLKDTVTGDVVNADLAQSF